MSTRATYQFMATQHLDATTTIYVHSDNYPEGTAQKLQNMLNQNNNYHLAESFIRGNPNAEITVSHDIHCDTEYCYDLFQDEGTVYISAFKIGSVGDDWDMKQWTQFFNGEVKDFIEKYKGK